MLTRLGRANTPEACSYFLRSPEGREPDSFLYLRPRIDTCSGGIFWGTATKVGMAESNTKFKVG